MTALLVIRHGPTDWNRAGRMQGRVDRPLDPAWCERVSPDWLPPAWDGARCVASPLKRAMDTAHLLGLQPEPEPLLIEMDWGAWEGRTVADLRAELGEAMAANEARGLDFRPDGGESPRDVQARLARWLPSLAGAPPTVAVTHKGVIRALYALATGWDMAKKPPQRLIDGCVHTFEVAPDGSPAVAELNIPLEPEA